MSNLARATIGDGSNRLNYKYEAIIDFMLAHPCMSRGEIAHKLGYTQAWFSTLVNSDAFRARYSERRQEMEEELVDRHVARLHSLAEKAAERVNEALEPGEDKPVDPRYALDVHSRVLANLGFGVKPTNGTNGSPTQVNVYAGSQQISLERLDAARQRLASVAKAELEDSGDPLRLPDKISEG